MEKKIENNNIIITLYERITYENANDFASELDDILNHSEFDKIILEASNLKMISSAGLRVILKLSKTYKKLDIINVIPEVYEIFEMTGFNEIINIRKAMRNIDISKASLIGDGFFSKVYRLNKDSIVKVFIKDESTLDKIEQELNLAKQAFILGIPTAISYDVVRVDNHYGVVFEMLDAGLLRDHFLNNPKNYQTLIQKYAKLVRKINSTKVYDTKIPSEKEKILNKIKLIKDDIDVDIYNKCYSMLLDIKETNTFLHNDCHIKNIMVSNDELFLIDMETFSYGNPIFELAGIYVSNYCFSEFNPEGQEKFFKISSIPFIKKIFDDMSRLYFEDLSIKAYLSNIKKIRVLAYLSMLFWAKDYSDNNLLFDFCYNILKNEINEIDNFNLKF